MLETYSHALSGYAARMTDAQAQELSSDPAVDSVVQDGYVHATQSPTPSWGLDRIDQHNLPLDNSYTPTVTAPGSPPT